MDVIRLSAALLVGLEVLMALLGDLDQHLPLGGSHLSQTMIVLGVGFFVQEIRAIWRTRNVDQK